jgi:hypothetical protein
MMVWKMCRYNRTIESFSPSDCKIFLSLRRKIYSDYFILRNVFGRDWSAQCRAFKYFITHIYENFKHLVTDNLHWWYRNGFFESSDDAIGKR